MKRRTQQEEYELLAELDRQERCMGLYGPYDPRAEEVMEGWRSAEYGPTQYTNEQREQMAAYWRSKVCRLGTAEENKDGGAYTPEEMESGERFNAACAQLADAIEAGKGAT